MQYIDGKGCKPELRSDKNYFAVIKSPNHATGYLWPRGMDTLHAYPHESDFQETSLLPVCAWFNICVCVLHNANISNSSI